MTDDTKPTETRTSVVVDRLYFIVSLASTAFFGLVSFRLLSPGYVSPALTVLTVLGWAMSFYRTRNPQTHQVNWLSKNSRLFTILLLLAVILVFVSVAAYRISGTKTDIYLYLAYFMTASFTALTAYLTAKLFKPS